VAWPPEWAGWQAGLGPAPPAPPRALVSAVRRPRPGGATLVLDAGGGRNIVVVLGDDSGEVGPMWSFIQKCLNGGKAILM
jgi:hypothetical protein